MNLMVTLKLACGHLCVSITVLPKGTIMLAFRIDLCVSVGIPMGNMDLLTAVTRLVILGHGINVEGSLLTQCIPLDLVSHV